MRAGAGSGGPRAAAAKRPITELDLMKFTWAADPQISRFAERTALVRAAVNEKDNKYESSIYVIAGTSGESAPRPLTSGTRDLSPRWSPDDKGLAFVRPDDQDTPQIWLLPLGGGEARAITDLANGQVVAGETSSTYEP